MFNCEVTNELFTVELLRSNPDKVYVFGDNLVRRGKKGQSVIRYEPNVIGITTKRLPSYLEEAYFKDRDDEFKMLRADLLRLLTLAKKEGGPTIVFPYNGLGTGLANMKEKSPKLWYYLCKVLKDYFGFVNDRLL